jgi:NAD(P)-dependent dehydrogenase (short-subunit alcohol dehydrogenase family)
MELLKTAVVTGANKGIGFQAARKLLERNYNVILACRSLENAEKAKLELAALTSAKGKIETAQLDVSSSESIKNFVAERQALKTRIDVLINNAGMAFKGDAFDDNVEYGLLFRNKIFMLILYTCVNITRW